MHLTSLLLLGALGASAHPSGHAHLHRHAHKRNPAPEPNPAVGDLVTATIEGKVVTWTNTYDGKGPFVVDEKPAAPVSSSPPAATSSAPAEVKAAEVKVASTPSSSETPKASATPSPSSGSDSGNGVTAYTPFCGGKKVKRVTAAQVAYKGNTGTADNWGCNMMLVANAEVADQYKYTAKFHGQSTKQSCVCFNKIGPTDLIDGFWHTAISWTMEPGTTQYVAFDANSQGSCVCASGSVPKTGLGQWAGAWTEFDFENTSNGGWSGADASILVAAANGMKNEGLKISYGGVDSIVYSDGTGVNAYLAGMEALDGVGLNIVPGKCQLDIQLEVSK